MAKLRKAKEEKDVELKAQEAEKETEKEVEQEVEQAVEVALATKSTANPAKDAEVEEAEEVLVKDQAELAEANKTAEPEVAVVEAPKKGNPNVRIKPNSDIKTYIGDSWYNLKKGKQETVPQSVKTILQAAGLLDAL